LKQNQGVDPLASTTQLPQILPDFKDQLLSSLLVPLTYLLTNLLTYLLTYLLIFASKFCQIFWAVLRYRRLYTALSQLFYWIFHEGPIYVDKKIYVDDRNG